MDKAHVSGNSISIDHDTAIIDVDGVKRKTNLLLLDDPKVGEYVIVHAGFAIYKIDASEAIASLEMLKKVIMPELNDQKKGD